MASAGSPELGIWYGPFDQTPQQSHLDLATKTNSAVALDDWNARSELFDQCRIRIDVLEIWLWQPANVASQGFCSLVTQVATLTGVKHQRVKSLAWARGTPCSRQFLEFGSSEESSSDYDTNESDGPPEPIILVPGSYHVRDAERRLNRPCQDEQQPESED